MSENLERKSADFVRTLSKCLCIFRPGKIFSLLRPRPRSITNMGRCYIFVLRFLVLGLTLKFGLFILTNFFSVTKLCR